MNCSASFSNRNGESHSDGTSHSTLQGTVSPVDAETALRQHLASIELPRSSSSISLATTSQSSGASLRPSTPIPIYSKLATVLDVINQALDIVDGSGSDPFGLDEIDLSSDIDSEYGDDEEDEDDFLLP